MARRIKDILLGTIPFIVLLVLWWVAYQLPFFPKWMIPSPFGTLSIFFKLMFDGTLIGLAWVSLQNILFGFVTACIVALVLGVAMGVNQTAKKIFAPFLSAVYTVPSLAWLPLIIIMLGFTRETIVFVIFMSSFKKIIYNVVSGVRNVNINWILVGKNIGLNKLEIIIKIILPGSLPQIITGVRMGFGSAWRSLIGAEMLIGSAGGLGKFIWMSQWYFDFGKVLSGIIVIALVGILAEQLVFKQLEEKTLVRWGFAREI